MLGDRFVPHRTERGAGQQFVEHHFPIWAWPAPLARPSLTRLRSMRYLHKTIWVPSGRVWWEEIPSLPRTQGLHR